MTKQFTASEVRKTGDELFAHNAAITRAMLHAYADRLEADERAVPDAVVNDSDNYGRGGHVVFADGRFAEEGMKLYTHPDPADAERLVQALRLCMDAMLEKGVPTHPDADARVAYTAAEEALAAHSAQAKPPAASVQDVTGLTWEAPDVTVNVERVGRFKSGDEHIVRVTFRSSDDGRRMTCFYAANESAAGYLHAMLAAQENPDDAL